MKLKQQVCSLDLAQRIDELLTLQGAYFWWVERTLEPGLTGHNPTVGVVASQDINRHQFHRVSDKLLAPAYTVAELGEMLPQEIEEERGSYIFAISKNDEDWEVGYDHHGSWAYHLGVDDILMQEAPTEADARAKMLIYLLRKKLLPLPPAQGNE